MPVSTISQAGLDAPISLTSPTLTTPNIDSAQIATVSGTAPLYMCRAWVNFNGTGTVAIRASGNVSSITDNGTGFYTVNFSTSMPDANYSWNGSVQRLDSGTNSVGGVYGVLNQQAAGSYQIRTSWADNGGTLDFPVVCISVFR